MKELLMVLEQLRDLLYAQAEGPARIQCAFTERCHLLKARYPRGFPLLLLQLQPLNAFSKKFEQGDYEVIRASAREKLYINTLETLASGFQARASSDDRNYLSRRVIEGFSSGYLEARFPLEHGHYEKKELSDEDFHGLASFGSFAAEFMRLLNADGEIWFRALLLNAKEVLPGGYSRAAWRDRPAGVHTLRLFNAPVEVESIGESVRGAALHLAQSFGLKHLPDR